MKSEELLEIATFADGSGKHSANLAAAEKRISKRENALKLLRAFILKYNDTLAGMSWDVDLFEPEINLGSCYRYYRGERVSCEFLAGLWKGVQWKRVKRKHSFGDDDGIRDWVGEVDGVTLRIERAENYAMPKPKFPAEGPVKLPS